jgi:hypothetical protein
MNNPLQSRRTSRWMFAPFAGVLVVAAVWSGFWFHAASTARAAIADWREREANLGRNYSCASPTLGGYPFRIEMRCSNVGAELRTAQPPLLVKAQDIVVVAQIYQPTLLIAEITGPVSIAEPGRPVVLVASWTLAQASARGLPDAPERLSLAIDGLRVERPTASSAETLFTANRLELHGRLDPRSTANNPILDLAAHLTGAVAPATGAAAIPIDADVTAVLRGLKRLELKPLKAQLQELQAAGGSLEVTNARVQQADTVAVAEGTLGLTPRARPDGTLRLTVAGLEQFLARSGFDKMLPSVTSDSATRSFGRLNSLAPILGGLDRLAPGLGAAAQNNANARTLAAGIALLGQRTDLEGRQAVVVPLRFSDGATYLGPIPLGQIAPLY